MAKPKGLKNSTGGAEPESSSPMAGDNKKRARAGEGLDSFIAFYLNSLIYYIFCMSCL
jgi:hypothetical protein